MIRRTLLPILFLALFVFLVSPALGDTLHLKNGKTFEGKVVKETATEIHFKIRGLGTQKFPKSMVAKIEKGASVFDQYELKRKELADDDAEGHFELGEWCKENNLRKEAKAEFKAAVAADPDHEGARKELGYVYYEGEWLTRKKYDEVTAEIRERENALIAAFRTDKTHKDEDAGFSVGIPEGGWQKEADAGLSVTFTGPELGKAPVTLHLEMITGESTLAENLPEFLEKWTKKLGNKFENYKKVGDPASAKLAGEDGKLVISTYKRDDITPEEIAMERMDLVAKSGDGYLRFSLECREGYRDRLKAFFDKVASSVKLLKPETAAPGGGGGPAATLERGYDLPMPDDTYEVSEGLPIRIMFGQVQLQIRPNTLVVASTTTPGAVFLVREGLKSEEGVDCTSLQTLRDALAHFTNVGNLTLPKGGESSTKVDGADALKGTLSLLGGQLGGGYWCVFMKGDRYYQCMFANFGNQMGDMYVKPDFEKFLKGFKFK